MVRTVGRKWQRRRRGVEGGERALPHPSLLVAPPPRFWFRLYWFPLKVLYATCHSSLQSVPDIPYYFFFNTLLLLLMVMNIYWFLVSPPLPVILRPGRSLCVGAKSLWQPQDFIGAFFFPQYIVAFAAKVLTGQMRELEDLREYDALEAQPAMPCKDE